MEKKGKEKWKNGKKKKWFEKKYGIFFNVNTLKIYLYKNRSNFFLLGKKDQNGRRKKK